jgi:hypothetical protein
MDTKNTKKRTWLCIDSGLYLELAAGLARHGDKVYYYTDWTSSFFPKYEDFAIGLGFDGVEKVKYFWDIIDKVDAIFCPDVHKNDMIAWLRKHFPEKPIYGSGQGEKIENSRWGLKKIISEIGLPLQESIKIKGIPALTEYIKKNPDKYVKIDIWRGTINSFYAKDYKSVELLLKDWEQALGIYADEFEFVVEEAIHTDNEFGVDTFFSGGEYSDYSYYGLELSKNSYLGKLVPTEKLPKPLLETMTKFKPVLKQLDVRSAVSTEEKIVTTAKHFFLDICMRAPNPLGLLYPEMIDNWPEMSWDIASNKPPKLKSMYKYVGAVPLYSNHTENHWVKVDFNPKLRSNIKFMTVCKKNGNYYAVKNSPEEVVCVLVAGDQTVDGVVKQLKKLAGEVDCYGIDKGAVGDLDRISETLNKAKEVIGTF